MNHTVPSPVRLRLLGASCAAALLLSACGASGGGSDAESDASTPTSAAADATTSTEPIEESTTTTVDLPSAQDSFRLGETLFTADPGDPSVGGFAIPTGGQFAAAGITVNLPANEHVVLSPQDETFEQGYAVTAAFAIGGLEATPDATFGVVCRYRDEANYYVGVAYPSPDQGGYAWGILQVVDGTFTSLGGSSPDEVVDVSGTVLNMGLVCIDTQEGLVLNLAVGSDYVGNTIVDEPEAGTGAGIYLETADFEGPLTATSFKVTEMVVG